MTLRINAIHFDATEKLEAFVTKKAEKLEHRNPAIAAVTVNLKVVKPETALNKQATIEVTMPQQPVFVADKTADTFEEAVDLAIEAIERQLEKVKNK